jgi:GAF domain-containing protein
MADNVSTRSRLILEDSLHRLRAQSCTLCVRAPWWTDEFRLVVTSGVRIPDPLYGFLLEPRWSRIPPEEDELFSTDTANDPRVLEPLDPERAALARRNPLFGDFLQREAVASCARFTHRQDGAVRAVFFVNYATPTAFDEPCRIQLRSLWGWVRTLLPGLTRELEEGDPVPIARLLRTLQPSDELARGALAGPVTEEMLDGFFGRILDAALEAFAVPAGAGFASLHLFDEATGVLQPRAFRPRDLAMPCIRAHEGEGILSWVAVTRRGLLIKDLEKSAFASLYVGVPGRPRARTMMAVPLLLGERCLGVLTLESPGPAFTPPDLRTLGYAAGQATTAYQLARQAMDNRRLVERAEGMLDVCRRAVAARGVGDGASTPATSPAQALTRCLDDLARLACEWTGADHCDIWLLDRATGQFREAGATHVVHPDERPRPGGWSAYVLAQGAPVWLSDMAASGSFRARRWDGAGWVDVAPGPGVPQGLHGLLVKLGLRCQLGAAIAAPNGEPVGMAWLKFTHEQPEPSARLVALATGFAGHAGLVIDFLRRATR